MKRTTEEAIAIAKEELAKHSRAYASEEYHITFDSLLEERLAELDPEYIFEMKKMYKDSNMSRWYA